MNLFMKFYDIMIQNGWMPNREDKYQVENLGVFELTLIGCTYRSRCFAYISEKAEDIDICGHLGIGWIDVEYEYTNRAYGYVDLEDMQQAINCAEKNLLAIGVPFQDNEYFHGTKAEIKEKIKLNTKLRKEWKLDELEEKMWNEYEEKNKQ